MNLNDQIKNMLNKQHVRVEVDMRCDSSTMITSKSIFDIMAISELERNMEVYASSIIVEISRFNKNCKFLNSNRFSLEFLKEVTRIIKNKQIPRIISIHKIANEYTSKERMQIKKTLKNVFIEEEQNVIFVVDTVVSPYPIVMNLVKMYGIDVGDIDIDYILLNDQSFDELIDTQIGIKKYLTETLDGLTYHNERMETVYARNNYGRR